MDAENDQIALVILGDSQDFVVWSARNHEFFDVRDPRRHLHDSLVEALCADSLGRHAISGEVGRRPEQRVVGNRAPLDDVEDRQLYSLGLGE